MILIVSDTADVQIPCVTAELDRLGVRHGLFNAVDFPTAAMVSQAFEPGADSCVLRLHSGAPVDARDVRAVWYRKPDLPRLHPDAAEHERLFSFRESQAGLRGLYDALSHAYWISPLDNIRAASNKLRQLRAATRLGLAVPRTLFTNDAEAAREFLDALDGEAVFKPIGDTALVTSEGPWDRGVVVAELFTTLLDSDTIAAGLERLSACPALLQESVSKDVELRITVVGDTVFAAELHSQAQEEARVDWRRGRPLEMEHRVHQLPPAIERSCVELVRSFGLEFGAIDMVLDPDGRYVLLELNPNGQYGWLEDLTPLRISRAIAGRLAEACDGYQRPHRSRAIG